MKIVICGSINFAEEMKKIGNQLSEMGHEVVVPLSIIKHSINSFEDAEKLKNRKDYIDIKIEATKFHFDEIKKGDAILVINSEKRGVKNYIGGATFAEMLFALYENKKIFLLNPIPEDKMFDFLRDEIETTKPVVINGDMNLIK